MAEPVGSGTARPFADTERGPKFSKQAVVVVHGMGEQRPLETLRSFVETVYQRDLSLTHDDDLQRVDDPVLGRVNRVWIVPDAATASLELRRISTPANANNVRTDFFEFYWADIMDGNPAELVWAWLRGLLLRSPFRVPRRTPVWIAWILLWVLAIVFIGFSYAIASPDSGPFGSTVTGIVDFLKGWRVPLSIVLAAAGILLLAYRAATTRPVSDMKFGLPVLLLAAAIVLFFLIDVLGTPRVMAGALSAAAAAIFASIVVPYVGDVVRYTRATPSTVAKREAVRARGLKLLRSLHEEKDWEGKRVYDRIVVVAHSLGAFVAYDLVSLLWDEIGPNHKQKKVPAPAVVAALRQVDQFVGRVWVDDPPVTDDDFPVDSYRAAQKGVFDALAGSQQGWLISDFVTVGSPLVHSEFLIADSRDEMGRSFKERFLSSSPPRPDEPEKSMLYGKGKIFAHFAAPFAAVRWTNIYDEHWFPLCGDIVSGPVASRDRFGPGIDEHRVEIRRPGLLSRFVTHSLYWTWQDGFKDKLPEHIRLLRAALDLAG